MKFTTLNLGDETPAPHAAAQTDEGGNQERPEAEQSSVVSEAQPQPQAASVVPRKSCPQCESEMSLQIENPQKGTGIIVLVMGLLLAPFCIGIPLIVWGAVMAGETRSYWHCRGCGRTFPF